MKDWMNKNKKLIICLLLALIIMIGGTYAILSVTKVGENKNTITVGDLSLTIENETNQISLNNAYPMTDEEGENTTIYEFSLKNDSDIAINYKVSLKDLDIAEGKTRMKDQYVKCKLQISGIKEEERVINLEELGRVLDSGTLNKKEELHYQLQLWMDYDAPNDAQGTVFKAKVGIEGEQAVK